MSTPVTRKLTTILAADAERFSTAMEADEMGTYSALKSARSVFFKLIERHGGRIANTAGDGLIADFPSVVEAAHCAIAVQQELAHEDNSLRFRIGIHLGDVICDGEDLLGEGVNLAARLQSLAEPGGILISRQVYDQVRNKLSLGFEYLGEQQAKNLPDEISVYRITTAADRDASIQKLAPKVEPSREEAQPKPQKPFSKLAQVWSDDFDSHNTRSDDASDAPEAPDDLRGRLGAYPTHMWVRYGVGGAVLLNVLTGGAFWVAWPILVFTLIYGLRRPVETLGLRSFKSIPARTCVLILFLIGVNLMSFSGPWSIFPIGALLLVHWLFKSRPLEE